MNKTRALVTLVVISPMLAVVPQPAAWSSATAAVRPVQPSQVPEVISEIRAVPTRQQGVSRPTSLAWDRTSRTLVVGAPGKVMRLALDGTYLGHTHVSGTP
ncbi:MAG: hypothetical protein M3P04_11985, partial [Actinomycetota bacterium]|nr:hypothetical protein [Actinomycetota bacterium]